VAVHPAASGLTRGPISGRGPRSLRPDLEVAIVGSEVLSPADLESSYGQPSPRRQPRRRFGHPRALVWRPEHHDVFWRRYPWVRERPSHEQSTERVRDNSVATAVATERSRDPKRSRIRP
jgi:hypothetical protein